jgi:hypothetical protein
MGPVPLLQYYYSQNFFGLRCWKHFFSSFYWNLMGLNFVELDCFDMESLELGVGLLLAGQCYAAVVAEPGAIWF